MVTSEGLQKFSKRTAIASVVPGVAGWPLFAGYINALTAPFVVADGRVSELNPFSGRTIYDAVNPSIDASGQIHVEWVKHLEPYSFQQGFNILMGDVTLAVLTTAGVAYAASKLMQR